MPDAPGFVQVGATSTGSLILDASRDAAVPQGATVLSVGAGRYSRAALGTRADRVLEAIWTKGSGSTMERGREKINAALARNPTVKIIATDLAPHEWMGET